MKITFNIDYRTNWGESLYITGRNFALGSDNPDKALKMEVADGHLWTATIDVPDSADPFEYRYLMKNSDTGYVRREWGSLTA